MAKVDFNYYALYLKKYLVDNDDPRKDDAEFINDRADLAGQEYESNRLNGLEVFQAEELAMEVLMAGLEQFVITFKLKDQAVMPGLSVCRENSLCHNNQQKYASLLPDAQETKACFGTKLLIRLST